MMAKRVKFVLNRTAFRNHILRGEGVDMEGALRRALPGDDVEIRSGRNRKYRMAARAYASMEDEIATGVLSRRLGGGG